MTLKKKTSTDISHKFALPAVICPHILVDLLYLWDYDQTLVPFL